MGSMGLRRTVLWAAVVVLAGWATWSLALERFPPPDFGPGYRLPVTSQTPPRADWREGVDALGVLGLLAAATFMAHRRRSRAGLFGVGLVAIAWFGFWRKGCVCPIGAIQNVSLGLADASFAVPLTVVVILLAPLALTALFGRTYCASVCPHGALQDLVLVHPVRVPRWLSAVLGLVPHIYLGVAVLLAATGSAFIICRFDPFIGLFRLSGSRDMVLLGALFLFASVFVGRPYCRFACPLGAAFSWLTRLAWRHVSITPDECIRCRLCEDACPFDAIRKPVPRELARDRRTGVGRLVGMLVLAPVLVVGTAWLGVKLAPALAQAHPQVRLAAALAAPGAPGEAVVAYRNRGGRLADAQHAADAIQGRFRIGSGCLGGYVGIVLAATLIRLSVRRAEPDYHIDRAECFACGRCYASCPREWVRRGRVGEQAPAKGPTA